MESKNNSTQTAVYSDYVGSLKGAKPKSQKKIVTDPNEWMKFTYPNRRKRRLYEAKGKKKYFRSKHDIQMKVSLFAKMMQVIDGNVEHGKMLHQSFENEVATDTMHFEQSVDARCAASLVEKYGPEKAKIVFDNNRRLRNIRADKKIGL